MLKVEKIVNEKAALSSLDSKRKDRKRVAAY